MPRPFPWILVTGAGLNTTADELAAASLLGRLLARENYGLIAGTWAGVDEYVTRAFLDAVPGDERPHRVKHILNSSRHSEHKIRIGNMLHSSPRLPFSDEAVHLAHAGVVVSGRKGSKPTMDALVRQGKPVIPLAWLGHDALETLLDLLRAIGSSRTSQWQRRHLLTLADPVAASDGTVSRILGACTSLPDEIFVSYHRSDTGADAARLAATLAETYSARRVFIDYTSFQAGGHLEQVIATAGRSRVVLVLLGPAFVERVARPTDYVRRELEAANSNHAIVVPLLVNRGLPAASELPESLEFLTTRNARVMDHNEWDLTMGAVLRAVDAALGVTTMKPS